MAPGSRPYPWRTFAFLVAVAQRPGELLGADFVIDLIVHVVRPSVEQ